MRCNQLRSSKHTLCFAKKPRGGSPNIRNIKTLKESFQVRGDTKHTINVWTLFGEEWADDKDTTLSCEAFPDREHADTPNIFFLWRPLVAKVCAHTNIQRISGDNCLTECPLTPNIHQFPKKNLLVECVPTQKIQHLFGNRVSGGVRTYTTHSFLGGVFWQSSRRPHNNIDYWDSFLAKCVATHKTQQFGGNRFLAECAPA